MYYYIVNPAAGKGRYRHIQDKLRSQLTQLGLVGDFTKTAGPGDATKLAAAAAEKGFNTIVIIGGDETVNEAVNGIADKGIAVGIIPIGTSNKLAHHLGITDWQAAIPILAARRLTSYALIAAGQKYFLSNLTIGLETDLDKRLDATSGLPQRVRRFTQGWQHARKFQPVEFKLKLDDSIEVGGKLFSMSIGNQKFQNAQASNQLVVSISAKPNRAQLGSYLWQWLRQDSPLEDIATTRLFASRILLETEPATGIMADGKLTGRTPMAIRLTDKEVRFICNKPQSEMAKRKTD